MGENTARHHRGWRHGNVYLIGFMGAGKSTVAAAMNRNYGLKVVEMDRMIEQKNGMSIPEIFEKKGEPYFRSEETALLTEAADMKNCIFSCGGGVPMREINVAEMRRGGTVVLLKASPETILKRVERSHNRPLLENNKTVEYIRELMEKRRPAYEAAADITVETDGKSLREICREICLKVDAWEKDGLACKKTRKTVQIDRKQ